jgi:hypothetical protein
MTGNREKINGLFRNGPQLGIACRQNSRRDRLKKRQKMLVFYNFNVQNIPVLRSITMHFIRSRGDSNLIEEFSLSACFYGANHTA